MEINFTKVPITFRKGFFIYIMKTFIFLFCAMSFGTSYEATFSQNVKIHIDTDKEISVIEAFELIKKETDYRFIYKMDNFKDAPKIKVNKGVITAHELLSKSLAFDNYYYELTAGRTIILKKINDSIATANQLRRISGIVADENGVPLLGATVLVEGTGRGTTTNFEGHYEISVNDGDVITYSFVGFVTQKITVGDQVTIDVFMKEDAAKLDEVVVVGYGKTTREKLTGAVTKVDVNILQTNQNVSFADALIGIVPGMLVQESFTNPDTPPSILLRGVGSINASTEPLIVIDGVQMPSGFASSAVNANDVEDISILKDASATSIYGSRGSNGVILITTKKGKNNSKLQVALSTRIGFKTPNTSFTDDIMNANQKLNYEESLGFYTSNPGLLEDRRNAGNNVDWSKLMLRNEVNRNHDISISGGGQNSNYYSSISYDEVDNMYGSNYERYTVKMSAGFDITEKLNLSLSGNFGNVGNQDRRIIGSPFSNAFLLNPWEQVFDTAGNPVRNITYIVGSGTPYNPLFIRDNTYTQSVRKNIGGSANLTYKPLEWLSLNGVIGANYNTSKRTTYENIIVEGGKLDLSSGDNSNYTATLSATIDKDFDKHNFNLVLGNEFNENEVYSFSGIAKGYQSDAVKTLGAASTPPDLYESQSHSGAISYFSRLNYSFDRTYNISLSYRRDGSSKFGLNNKYANFWAIGASWNIYRDFFKDSDSFLSDLKLRVSKGASGNDFIGDFASRSLYQYRYNYSDIGVPTLSRGSNPNLTWEKNLSTNIGLDFGMFNSRLSGSFDYYIRTTKDLLSDLPIPLTSGFESLNANIGEFENKGFEISLHSINVKTADFLWTTDVNFANNKSEVVSLTEDRNLILRGNIAYKPGSPINALYMVEWAGVNPDTGFNRYRAADGSLVDYNTDVYNGNRNEITGMRSVSDKSAIPTYHGGITNSFAYKNFDASFLVSFSGGNYVINSGLYDLYNNVNLNQSLDVLNAWKNPGDQTDIALRAINTINPTRIIESDFQASTQFLQDASYIKLKTVAIGYTIDDNFSKRMGIDRLRIFAQAQNLLTITDVDYIDPEYAIGTGGIGLSSSVNKGFSFGINLNF